MGILYSPQLEQSRRPPSIPLSSVHAVVSLVPWIPDISLINKLPCCNALSTRNRAYIRRVIDSLYCPDPCPRLELTVPTFELIHTSRGLLLGVSELSRITPRGRKFDVTFCNACNLHLRRLLGQARRVTGRALVSPSSNSAVSFFQPP